MKIINTTKILMFENTTKTLMFDNSTETLMFEIKSYHEGLETYRILVDFMDVFGGIY